MMAVKKVQIASWDDNHNYFDTDGNVYRTMGDFAPSEGQWVWTNGKCIYGHTSAGGGDVIANKVEGAPFISGLYYGYIDGNLDYKFINDNMENGHINEWFDYFVNNYDYAWMGFDRDFYRNDGMHIHANGYVKDVDVDNDGNLLMLIENGNNFKKISIKDHYDDQRWIDLYQKVSAGNMDADDGVVEGHVKSFKQAYKDTVVHRTTTWDDRDITYVKKYIADQFTIKSESEETETIELWRNDEIIKEIDLKSVLADMENEVFDYIGLIDFNHPGEKIGTPPDPYIIERHNNVIYCCISNDKNDVFFDATATIKILLPVYLPEFVTKTIDFNYYFYDTFHVLGWGHIFPYIEQREKSRLIKGYINQYHKAYLTLTISYTYDHGNITPCFKMLRFDFGYDILNHIDLPNGGYCDYSNFSIFGQPAFKPTKNSKTEYTVSSDLYYVDHDKYAEIGDFYYDMPPTQVKGVRQNYSYNYQFSKTNAIKEILRKFSLCPIHDYWLCNLDYDNTSITFDGHNIEMKEYEIISAYAGTKKGDYLIHTVYGGYDCAIKNGSLIPSGTWQETPGYCNIQNYRVRNYHNVVQLLADINAVIEQINGGA